VKSKKLHTGKRKKKSTARPKRAKAAAAGSQDESAIDSLDLLRTGMPARDSITGVKEFRKGDKVYRLIETNEVDEYEEPPKRKQRQHPK
jgi:hypothetical protein